MKVIFKYQMSADVATWYLPKGAVVRNVHSQGAGDFPVLWIEHNVDPDSETEERNFVFRGTGHSFDASTDLAYLGSAHCGPFVWHVFEVAP